MFGKRVVILADLEEREEFVLAPGCFSEAKVSSDDVVQAFDFEN